MALRGNKADSWRRISSMATNYSDWKETAYTEAKNLCMVVPRIQFGGRPWPLCLFAGPSRTDL